jgi:hypothetical protein
MHVLVLCSQGEKRHNVRRAERHLTDDLTSLLITVALPEMEN